MSVTRGTFLRSLSRSIPGMLLGGGALAATHKLVGKLAAVSDPGLTGTAATSTVAPVSTLPKAEFIKSGPTEGNRIALTFDDGPTPGVTDVILDELKRRQLHATFFMIGNRITLAPDLARRVLDEGNEIGNHSLTHPRLSELSDTKVETEIGETQDIIRNLLNHRPRWFRPPYGALRPNQAGILQKAGLGIIMWSIDPGDWAQPGEEKILGTILGEAKAGAIILCHDSHAQTARCVGAILDGLLERGLTPVTVSRLLP